MANFYFTYSILTLIILSIIGQISTYLISDKNNLKYVKSITFFLLLIGHLFIFPLLLFPQSNHNEIKCGSEPLGITLTFWVFGCGVTVLIHCIYYFRRIIQQKY